MASRSAIVLVVLVVAVIAFCFAGVFAAMTGTYHLNLDFGNNTTEETSLFGNLSDLTSGDNSGSSDDSYVETYTDSGSSESSQSSVETTEDTSSSSQTEQSSSSDGGGSVETTTYPTEA
ncbi:hypothetical protein [Methanobrevibacter sp.]|uniref:hypothetical protein n=1 Tax=Methanobrevibacter sp. TaxID=66852 RepID=UPI00388D9EEC